MSLSWAGIILGLRWVALPGIGRTQTASGRLWCRAEGPEPSHHIIDRHKSRLVTSDSTILQTCKKSDFVFALVKDVAMSYPRACHKRNKRTHRMQSNYANVKDAEPTMDMSYVAF
eukprot:1139202-Pelagomonas_calceolata.AAC.1